MKKTINRVLSLLMAVAIMASVTTVGFAATEDANAAADALHELGLFNGSGTGADGKPIYELDRTPTRQEAIAMLVRLLGKEQEAQTGAWKHPFTDVDKWARPYVGYAYANGLTGGTGPTTFSGNDTVTASQYLTFVLRALGYADGADFRWDSAWTLSDQLGITNGEYGADTSFTRGDVALISYHALSTPLKGGDKTLLDQLGLGSSTPDFEPRISSTSTKTHDNSSDAALHQGWEDAQTAIAKSLPQNVYVPTNEQYIDNHFPWRDKDDDYTAVAMYLSRLSEYMPHVTEEQRTTVSLFPFSDGYNYVHAVSDTSVLPAIDATLEAYSGDGYGIKVNGKAYTSYDPAVIGNYKGQGLLTNRYLAKTVASDGVEDWVADKFSAGRFVYMRGGGKDVGSSYQGVSYIPVPHVDLWLSGSMRNDTVLRNVYLNQHTSYYGENTFRGSAVETVVFPYYWYSDHNVYADMGPKCCGYSDGSVEGVTLDAYMPLGVRNDLLLGKNANIIEANSFADCQNLKSVIIPCEPAHLYIADGVFANCPQLTVYGPAGGTLESYCKAHGVKFQAIPEATIEEPLPSNVAPSMYTFDHSEEYSTEQTIHVREDGTWAKERWSYHRIYAYTTIRGHVASVDGTSNYPSAMGVIFRDVASWNDQIAKYGTDLPTIRKELECLNATQYDLNRYRSEAANAKEIFDNHGCTIIF